MAQPLFIFGTLCYAPLLEAVIGDTRHLTRVAAQLPGYQVRAVRGGAFPVISAQDTATTDGLLVSGLTAADRDKLSFYEAVFDYSPQPVSVSGDEAALAYMPPDGRWEGVTPWDLDAWIKTWGDLSLRAARDVMRYKGIKTAQEVAVMMPMIRARAASAAKAEVSRHGARTLQGTIDVHDISRPYADYFAVDAYKLRHTRFEGDFSPVLDRAVFLSPDAALVMPYDAARDRVLLVEQFRMGPLGRGDRSLWQLEPVAGRLDPGEQAEEAARRETREEAGLELGALHPVCEIYPSPGTSSEFFYLFVGEADLPNLTQRTGGLATEDEDIRSHILGFDELMHMCDHFQLANSPVLILSLWLARNRTRLRAEAGF